jgi:hypothetical protein
MNSRASRSKFSMKSSTDDLLLKDSRQVLEDITQNKLTEINQMSNSGYQKYP